jgi:peptide/nickel transport system permease protein
MGIAAAIGIVVVSLAGYFGGWIDFALSRLVELVLCIPTLVLILALLAIIEQATIWHIMGVIGATSWTSIARLTRGEFLRLKEMDFVAAARTTGLSEFRIIFRYILPNALAPVLVPITFGIAAAILIESGLSFLGFGAPPPNPSWGTLLSAGRTNYMMWWLILFPGLAIFFTVLATQAKGCRKRPTRGCAKAAGTTLNDRYVPLAPPVTFQGRLLIQFGTGEPVPPM